MSDLLGEEMQAYLDTMQHMPQRGIRINTLKMENDPTLLPFELETSAFSPYGYRLLSQAKIGTSPFHHSGAVYSQEPSAMSAVTALDVQPGQRVLDMCAAPGGKSTQIAAALGGEGFLLANEYVRSRAQVLLSNIERMGISNAAVCSSHPSAIAEQLPEYFDCVLVDAPCSGEGMMRKEEAAVREWSVAHVETCAVRQQAILSDAAKCVKSGGVLVYSTCTFSLDENEKTVVQFLQSHPDFSLEPIAAQFGRCGIDIDNRFDLTLTRRVYPMDGGEGHFVARMRKSGAAEYAVDTYRRQVRTKPTDAERCTLEMLEECLHSVPQGSLEQIGNNVYLMPHDLPELRTLGVLRAGVLAGEIKQERRGVRIEPAHALFMSRRAENCRRVIDLAHDSAQLLAFLRGEEIEAEDNMRGFAAVACNGIVTGFGKVSGGVLKNRYPKGLRNN